MENASMNKRITALLAVIAVSSSAFASESYNKTHYNIRVNRDNVPAYTTFHQLNSDKEEGLGGKVQVTGFYGQSVNGAELAKNFGANGTDSVIVDVTGTYAQH